jgi:hypothetical protein
MNLENLNDAPEGEIISSGDDLSKYTPETRNLPTEFRRLIGERGRHKKGCPCSLCAAKNETKKKFAEHETKNERLSYVPDTNINAEDALNASIEKFNNLVPEEPEDFEDEPIETNSQTSKISGIMLLTMVDFVAPFIVVKLMGFLSPKYKGVDTSNLHLTMEEKKDLEEVAEMVANEYVEMRPLPLLLISLTATYYTKIQMEVQLKDTKK